jgi:hypothetical protein
MHRLTLQPFFAGRAVLLPALILGRIDNYRFIKKYRLLL